MHFRLNKFMCFFILFCLFSFQAHASEGTDNSFNLTEVSPGNFVHKGVHVTFEHPEHDDIANIGFIIGDDCVAVIDTGGSVDIGKQLLAAVRKQTDKPICYVINTHVHFDHVLGNIAFKSEQTQFVGHVDLADAIAANRDFFINEFKDDLGEFANADGIIGPTMLVEDKLELDLGNRILELTAWPTAHSHTDVTVLDKKTNTIWLSDLLFSQRIPVIDGKLKGWLKVINTLEQENYTIVVPGHGDVSSSWPGAMQAQKDYLEFLLNETRQQIAQGAFMEDVVETLGKNESQSWLLHEQSHKRNVTKAFTELEWE